MEYDKRGNKISSIEVGKLHSDMHYRIIGNTQVNGLNVSTVWLGIDHGYDGGDPIIFETMIFPEGEWGEEYCERYTTEGDAALGHLKAVEWAKNYDKEEPTAPSD